MYNKELESSADAKAQHDKNQRAAASERLAKNAKWKKEHKPKTNKE